MEIFKVCCFIFIFDNKIRWKWKFSNDIITVYAEKEDLTCEKGQFTLRKS